MIEPHAAKALKPLYVQDPKQRAELISEAATLPALLVSSAASANAVMLGGGYFTPLPGFMDLADALGVAESMHTAAGLFWPVPIVNMVRDAASLQGKRRIALRDPNVDGQPVVAIQEVQKIETATDTQMQRMTERVFCTTDPKHPGVAAFNGAGRTLISGPVTVLSHSYFEPEFPKTYRTAYQIRAEIQGLGWDKVVAFQTRNPMHRAHEELCRMAHHDVGADGILIHMLLGKLKAGDIPAEVRDQCIRAMVQNYFPKGTVLITGYGFDMLYAGPREAVLHAVFRQNAGCTHLIVGRDHAGVGSYYGPFDAQTIFDREVPAGALRIQIYKADNTAWSKKLGRVVMMKDAPDHRPEDFINLSGTKVREMLSKGEALPPEFSRPECAEILKRYYQSTAA
ncbi:MAG: sulfate adenylyltransferase [Deltaproteobacteria bacterium]|nr:sulfate adenylyltransferase [Deltaproteobacteria bacterium]